MFIKGKLAAPQPSYLEFEVPEFARILETPATLFEAPAGYLLTESLSARLASTQTPVQWIRLGVEDCDPGTLLLSLTRGCQQLSPEIGTTTFKKMRRQPGPIAGWEPLFNELALEANAGLPPGSTLVIENLEKLKLAPACLKLLGLEFTPRLRPDLHLALISREGTPRSSFMGQVRLVDVHGLQFDDYYTIRAVRRHSSGLSASTIEHAHQLCEGRPVALVSLLEAEKWLGSSTVDRMIHQARNVNNLFSEIASAGLKGADSSVFESMAIALQLEYSHPSLKLVSQPAYPWVQSLTDRWERVRDLWLNPLQKVIRQKNLPRVSVLKEMSASLADQDAYYSAILVDLDQRQTRQAAFHMDRMAQRMMDLGQWATLNTWLKRLPEKDLTEYPWLVYIRGKIAASQGQMEVARKAFATAADLFGNRKDDHGVCLSMLAESALAAWRGELLLSKERALSAYALAQRSGLELQKSWSAWQLGSMAAVAGELSEALDWFRTKSIPSDEGQPPPVQSLLHNAEGLIRLKQQFHEMREYYQRALREAEESENEVSNRLENLLNLPPENMEALLEAYGWTQTPLVHASATIQPMPGERESTGLAGLFHELLHNVEKQLNPVQTGLPEPGLPKSLPVEEHSEDIIPPPAPIQTNSRRSPQREATPLPLFPNYKNEETKESIPSLSKADAISKRLRICFLGSFTVDWGVQELSNWPNKRAKQIFKYLAFHHTTYTARELLMDIFWPEADSKQSLNGLNVCLHSLRESLKSCIASPLEFKEGAYRLAPNLEIWVDEEEFEQQIEKGRRLEDYGEIDQALEVYEKAVVLYHGDFLNDDLYEEWTVQIRERLRILYLDTLDRMSQFYFTRNDYNACIALCQSIIRSDICREDAHCRLMRCYSRLDQDYLALRQYQVCLDALRSEMDVEPEPATTELYEQIRRRERI